MASAFSLLTAGTRLKSKRAVQPSPAVETTPDASTFFKDVGPSPSKRRKVDKDEASAAAELRAAHKIKVSGAAARNVPAPLSSFADLGERGEGAATVLENLRAMGFDTPTAIQLQCVPIMLAGFDLLAGAPTGSGKTLAFLLPLLLDHLARGSASDLTAIVIEPTRELARQVGAEATKLAKGTDWRVAVLGEAGQDAATADLVIATPLRLVHALKAELSAASLRTLVLDEADKLFDTDFLAQTDDIIASCPEGVRKAMFSATIPSGVEELARTVMGVDVLRVLVGHMGAAGATIEQKLMFVGTEEGKLQSLRSLGAEGQLRPPVLVFVQSVERATQLYAQIALDNLRADVLHSDRPKEDRDEVVRRFARGDVWVLIATDVMARGVDYRGVNLVINYDFPQTVQSYIHRIGRTGRAGRPGKAITLFTTSDAAHLRTIVNVMRESGCDVPGWMLELKAPSKNDKRKLRKRPTERDAVGGKQAARRRSGKPSKRSRTDRDGSDDAASANEAESGDDSPAWQGI